jgi:hypothetical protein
MHLKRIALFLLMIGIGLGAGLLYGWVIVPTQRPDTSLHLLRADYKADYVLMVAEIYQSDQNLEQARQQLSQLDDSLPAHQIVSNALKTAQELNYPTTDQESMVHLAQALQIPPNAPTHGATP